MVVWESVSGPSFVCGAFSNAGRVIGIVTLLDLIHDILLFLVEDVVVAWQHMFACNTTPLVSFLHESELVLFFGQTLDVVHGLLVLDFEPLLTDNNEV